MGLISLIASGIMDANKAIKQKNAQHDTSMQRVERNSFCLEIPSFLSPTQKLSKDASVQYMNSTLDVNFQVIDESKSEFLSTRKEMADHGILPHQDSLLDDFASMCISNLFDLDQTDIGDYLSTHIGGLPAITLSAFQKHTFLKDAVYAKMAFIEGADTLYQVIYIVAGTSISKLADSLEQSIYTFRERNPNPVAPSVAINHTSHEPVVERRYCTSCGQPIPIDALFCIHCGEKQLYVL